MFNIEFYYFVLYLIDNYILLQVLILSFIISFFKY